VIDAEFKDVTVDEQGTGGKLLESDKVKSTPKNTRDKD
jgi:hypothetical protein